MDKLSGMLAFVKTAELGSFVAAGRALEISASAVGKGVARLEQEVGVRLLQRSTRRIQLTAEGRLFHERCRRVLDDLDDAQAMLSLSRETPRGKLRVSAPIVGYHFLIPLVPEFLARYPEVELDITFSDGVIDLIDEGIDVAIRSGDLRDSRLVSRPLQTFRLLLCAAPSYLERHGAPAGLRDLAQHACVRFRHPDSGKLLDWPWREDLAGDEPRLRTVLACNNIEAVLGAILRGDWYCLLARLSGARCPGRRAAGERAGAAPGPGLPVPGVVALQSPSVAQGARVGGSSGRAVVQPAIIATIPTTIPRECT